MSVSKINYPIKSVIATRIFDWEDPNGKSHQVQLMIGEPGKEIDVMNNTERWYCPFQFLGLGLPVTRTAYGDDSLQAIYSALVLSGGL